MHLPIKRVWFQNLKFDITNEVFEPSDDSFLIAENLTIHKGDEVLDLGTGCGILGILAASQNAKYVLAVDVNPYAINCTKQNATLNNVQDNMCFLRSDLLSALNNSALFDLILFNAPYLPSEPHEIETWLGRAWAGGANGRDVIDRFIPQVSAHLKPSGRVFLLQSSLTGLELSIQKFFEYGLSAIVKAECKLPFFETIHLIEAQSILFNSNT
ncbi:MAG: class I SAM-dependent methyltransferase [Candidatus Bathyarchaeota archaeon]|nr:class I SAM-dependent methyltransferase [Candidatus Termiticorpusculum sp.]